MDYKLASAIHEYYPIMAIVLTVLAGIGGFWLYENSQPSYHTKSTDEVSWTYKGAFDHKAAVEKPNLLWRRNQILKNRSTYFLSITPRLETTFRLEINGATSATGELELDADLVILSKGEKTEYWRESKDLRENVSSLSDGVFLSKVELYIPQVKARIENIQKSLDFTGGSTEAKIVVTATMSGSVNGKDVEKTETYESKIDIGRSTYNVGPNISRTEEVTETFTREVKESPSILSRIPPLLLILIPVAVLGYVSFEKRNLTKSKLRNLKEKRELEKFEEWVSRGSLKEMEFKAEIEMETLEDLVDAAIDMDRRVILDADQSLYFFIHEDIAYTYKRTFSMAGALS